eukprot:9794907-Alexandrium_andersonii.AAC.1
MAAGDQYTEYFTELAAEALQGAGWWFCRSGLGGGRRSRPALSGDRGVWALHASQGLGFVARQG